MTVEDDVLRAPKLVAEIKSLSSEARRLGRVVIRTKDYAQLERIIMRTDEIAKRLVALRIEAERAAKRMLRAGVRI